MNEKFEKTMHIIVRVVLCIVMILSALLFFRPYLSSGYEGVIENDGMTLAVMYGISAVAFVVGSRMKK